VGIVTALPEELLPLIKRTAAIRRTRKGHHRFYRGRMGQAHVVMTRTGDGRLNAERGLEALLETFQVSGLLGAGLAGGLSPTLEVGSLLVAGQVRDLSEFAPAPHEPWIERARREGAGVKIGTLVTLDRILGSPSEKADLWSRLRQESPAAVDMESAVWAHIAGRDGIPYLIVRAISDVAGEELPRFIAECRDSNGSVSRFKVTRYALGHPRSLALLLKLRARVRSCAHGLAEFIENFLNASP